MTEQKRYEFYVEELVKAGGAKRGGEN